MPREQYCISQNRSISDASEADLLAFLWETAPFPRMPTDAPPELKDYLLGVEDPRHVYTIHRASRRHNVQLLVERFVVQLRHGCGSRVCNTPSCFSCRKRLVGKAPIRRYNETSARTLAVYMAGRDNPEAALCPHLGPVDNSSAAVNSLMFFAASPKTASGASSRYQNPRIIRTHMKSLALSDSSFASTADLPSTASPLSTTSPQRASPRPSTTSSTSKAQTSQASPSETDPVGIVEKPISKDHRSFPANLLSTAPFKLLEFLTPRSLAAIQTRASDNSTPLDLSSPDANPPLSDTSDGSGKTPSPPEIADVAPVIVKDEPITPSVNLPAPTPTPAAPSAPSRDQEVEAPPIPPNAQTTPAPRQGSKRRRNSSTRVRTPSTSTSKPSRKLSVEPFPPPVSLDDPSNPLLSPRFHTMHPEKVPRLPRSGPLSSRTLSDPPHFSAIIDGTNKSNPSKHTFEEPRSKPLEKTPTTLAEEPEQRSAEADVGHAYEEEMPPASSKTTDQIAPEVASEDVLDESAENELPQTLSRFNPDIVEFLCDTLQDVGPSEAMKRRSEPVEAAEDLALDPLKLEWRLFIEQSFFYVLSHPQALLHSFTVDGTLIDPRQIQDGLSRLISVSPTLVFHSLWIAASSLFRAPRSLQSLQSPVARAFRTREASLSIQETGNVMAICLHALVAALPGAVYNDQLVDVSRARANGLVSPERDVHVGLSLQLDEVLSNDMALRLARRLLCATIAQQYFAELTECDQGTDWEDEDKQASWDNPKTSVLACCLSQLNSINPDESPELGAIHKNMPRLLLDWARAVLLEDWDGQAEFTRNSALGGALVLIETLHSWRHKLHISDVSFRVDYIANRIGTADVAASWLFFTPTQQQRHLLDFPYIFDPATLVTHFRSINYTRMSRSYEESASTQERMKPIISGALVQNHHHKDVLQEMLSMATCRYLILNVSRTMIVEDAFNQLWHREERELLRPLKVHLGEDGGEEGLDLGGVQQEFFRLIIAGCLNPDYGAFSIDERTKMAWFVPGSVVEPWQFEMIGLVFSLAVYNGLTLPVTFPKALYRKLLGEPIDQLHHIADGWPDLVTGLETLLEWDESNGLVEDVFARTYEFSHSQFGQPVSREMTAERGEWPRGVALSLYEQPPSSGNPDDAPMVTSENREEYVSDYIQYLTDVSVRPQFEAFEKGFRACLHPKSLQLLNSGLLQLVVEGVQTIDMAELKQTARYVGWDATHRTVKDFWSIVKKYDEPMKRKLLEFVTASDRVPVGGIKNVQFVIQRNGQEEGGGHLPTAYTCYGTLLLPEYSEKEVLRERLGMALENAQGFGFA